MNAAPNLSKADRIRKYMKEHPKATPAEVAKALAQYGINAAYVSLVLYKDKERATIKKVKANGNGDAQPVIPVDVQLSSQLLLLATKLIQQTGSLQQAQVVLRSVDEYMRLINPIKS